MQLTPEERAARVQAYAGSQSERQYAAYLDRCKAEGREPSYCDVVEWAEGI